MGRTGKGLVVLLGVSTEDGEEDVRYLIERIVNLRIVPDEENRFNRSALDTGAELLVLSQFILYADTRKGHRPDFTQAARPQEAEHFIQGRWQRSGTRASEWRLGVSASTWW